VAIVPPVRAHGLINYPEMLALYSTAWCAVDLMAPNLERELALSFRQLDALQCGVPLLVGAHAPLAEEVRAYDAGWVVAHGDQAALDAAIDEILGDPAGVEARSRNAHRLARERFDAALTIRPLIERIQSPTRRTGRETLAAAMARRAVEARAQEEGLARLQREHDALRADLAKKETELQTLDLRMRGSMDTIGALSTALEAALYLKKSGGEQSAVELDESRTRLLATERSLEAARREIAKKDRETERLLTQRDQLEADLAHLHEAHDRARERADVAQLEVAQLRVRIQALEDQVAAAARELMAVRDERDKKQREIEALWQTRDALVDENERIVGRLQSAEAALVHVKQGGGRSPGVQLVDQLEAIEHHLEALRAALGEAGAPSGEVADGPFDAGRRAVEGALRTMGAAVRRRKGPG
jgi:chromosome segregation ATPase